MIVDRLIERHWAVRASNKWLGRGHAGKVVEKDEEE